MGSTQSFLSKWTAYETAYPLSNEYYGAGCMWISDTHVLAGIHTRQSRSHKPNKISGLGGKTLPGEVWWQTAFRETVEDMFGVETVPTELLNLLRSRLAPLTVVHQSTPSYITLVFSFADLKQFLKLSRRFIQSPLYSPFPKTVDELVFNRRSSDKSDVSHIVYWPRIFQGSRFRFSSDLLHNLSQTKNVHTE